MNTLGVILLCLGVVLGFIFGILFMVLSKRTAILVKSEEMWAGTFRSGVLVRNGATYYLAEEVTIDRSDPANVVVAALPDKDPLIVVSRNPLPPLFEAKEQKVAIVPIN
jgi:hypothetical protein